VHLGLDLRVEFTARRLTDRILAGDSERLQSLEKARNGQVRDAGSRCSIGARAEPPYHLLQSR
jgi:hypothetical protein